MSAEKKYRLLDVGEDYRDGDDILTVSNGWRSVSGCGTVQAHTAPMRRPDDGNGTCIIVNDCSGEDYWKWGVGWVQANSVYPYASLSYVWRKPREVEKQTVEPSTGNWIVAVDDDCWPFLTESEATTWAKEIARNRDEGTLVRVAKIVREIQIKVEFVVKEVGK